MKGQPWTNQENSTVIDNVAQSPTNIDKALVKSAMEVGRTPAAVRAHYYKNLRNQLNALNIVNKNGDTFNSNVKNTPVKVKTIEENVITVETLINVLSVEQLKEIVIKFLTGQAK